MFYHDIFRKKHMSQKVLPPINMLVITDTHNCFQPDWLDIVDAVNYDVCFFLGDIGGKDYEAILPHIKFPFYGFPGNHDDIETLEKYNVPNIHGTVIEEKGIHFAGWGGSLWYKDGADISFTQKESMLFADALSESDVLLSHDTCNKLFGTSNPVHMGLKGIRKYCIKKQPILNIHGHHHKNAIHQVGNTKVIGVFRCALIDETGNIKVLF